MANEGTRNGTNKWMSLVILPLLAAYIYVLMEWLFFITKPSFMSTLGVLDRMKVLFVAPVPIVAVGLAWVLLFFIPALISRSRAVRSICFALGLALPAWIISLAVLLVIDNFTYTILHFGIRSSFGFLRVIYAVLLLGIFVILYRFLYRGTRKPAGSRLQGAALPVAVSLLSVSLAWVIAADLSPGRSTPGRQGMNARLERPVNVLIISSDGLNARNMSAYGYERDTTPYIKSLTGRVLFCENNFTNAGTSAASIASMFTGKSPTRTKLIYHPDILKGIDAYEHMPGILRQHGYRNVEISIRHHTDPYDLNMRNAFDVANKRTMAGSSMPEAVISLLGQEPAYFLGRMYDRISDRLLHAFMVREMVDPMAEVVKSGKKYGTDTGRMIALFEFIDAYRQPFFAHVHLLGTHGPLFGVRNRVFSAGQKQKDRWMPDFYDDAILAFDDQVREIIAGLDERSILENTIIVMCSDHGQKWTYDERLPLIFLFPGGEHAGRITANTQNLDVAPTLLDYLGIDKPAWMEGISLISRAPERGRPIFIVDRRRGLTGVGRRREEGDAEIGPPFYTLGYVGVLLYDRLFMLDLDESALAMSRIGGHTAPCRDEDMPAAGEAARMIIDHLEEGGYDTSSMHPPDHYRNE